MFSGFEFPVVASRLWEYCGHLELPVSVSTFHVSFSSFGTRRIVVELEIEVQTANQNQDQRRTTWLNDNLLKVSSSSSSSSLGSGTIRAMSCTLRSGTGWT